MPTFRIVYIDDDTFAPRSLTAEFPDRAAAEIALAKHGLRVVHIAPLTAGETAVDPVRIAMAAAQVAAPRGPHMPDERRRRTLPRYDLAGAGVALVGLAVAGVAFLLF